MAPDHIVQREHIFRAVKGIVPGSLGRTLAECLYWSQYAQQHVGSDPQIYKTGNELGQVLGMSPRTANTHLKKLERSGYWEIEYKPKPGHPSLVTWLRFLQPAAVTLALARSLQAERTATSTRAKKPSFECTETELSIVAKTDDQQSQNVTLKHWEKTPTTSVGQKKSFLLSKEQQKQASGKKEAFLILSKNPGKGEFQKAPSYIKAGKENERFAAIIRDALNERNLPDWDWISQYTWVHTQEIRAKLQKDGIVDEEGWAEFVERLLCNWDWLRICMINRYSQSDHNLHRPSPMALAFEFEKIAKAIKGKYQPKEPVSNHSSLDDGLS